MRRWIFAVSLVVFGGIAYADMPSDGTVTWGSESKSVTISSGTNLPTQILTDTPFIQRTWIINNTTFTVMIATFTHTFNPATEVTIPASTVFSPDGPTVAYWGPMFAVLNGTSTALNGNNISILRTK